MLRMVVGSQLRRLREARGIAMEAAGELIRASPAKISRLELGRVGFKPCDVADLLTLYGVTDTQERDAFLTLARRASTPGWWRQYGDILPSWFGTYLGLEQGASILRSYEPQLVPGLLQTQDYARAVIELHYAHESADEIERRIALRMARQRFLALPEAPDLWVVIDEAALRRPVGGRQVFRAQLRHLIDAAELPNVTVQVVLFSAGGYPTAGGSFTILRFAEPDLPDIVYLEQFLSALYLDKKHETDNYLTMIDRLCVQAQSATATIDFLHGILAKS